MKIKLTRKESSKIYLMHMISFVGRISLHIPMLGLIKAIDMTKTEFWILIGVGIVLLFLSMYMEDKYITITDMDKN